MKNVDPGVQIGNKVIGDHDSENNQRFKLSRKTKVIINLTPRTGDEEPYQKADREQTFKHYTYNNKTHKWEYSYTTKRGTQKKECEFIPIDLEKMNGNVSLTHPKTGKEYRYSIYTMDWSKDVKETFEIGSYNAGGTILTGENPFIPTQETKLINEINQNNGASLDLLTRVQDLKKEIDPLYINGKLKTLHEILKNTTNNNYNISLGLYEEIEMMDSEMRMENHKKMKHPKHPKYFRYH